MLVRLWRIPNALCRDADLLRLALSIDEAGAANLRLHTPTSVLGSSRSTFRAPTNANPPRIARISRIKTPDPRRSDHRLGIRAIRVIRGQNDRGVFAQILSPSLLAKSFPRRSSAARTQFQSTTDYTDITEKTREPRRSNLRLGLRAIRSLSLNLLFCCVHVSSSPVVRKPRIARMNTDQGRTRWWFDPCRSVPSVVNFFFRHLVAASPR